MSYLTLFIFIFQTSFWCNTARRFLVTTGLEANMNVLTPSVSVSLSSLKRMLGYFAVYPLLSTDIDDYPGLFLQLHYYKILLCLHERFHYYLHYLMLIVQDYGLEKIGTKVHCITFVIRYQTSCVYISENELQSVIFHYIV